MIDKAQVPDLLALRAAVMQRADAVVFVGDGEPQTPQSMVEGLVSALAAGTLQRDIYARGGTVEALEHRMAAELGKEAAIWLPTGTLANHIALRRHCTTRSRIAVQEQSHVYHDSGDALATLSGLNTIALAHGRPAFTVDELRIALQQSVSGRVLNPLGAVSVESPVRRQAGQIVAWDEMQAISRLCKEQGIPIHLDGARIYMMSAATGICVKDYAALFDSVYVSTWKYFGAPYGAIVAGRHEFINGMFHHRRMLGGSLPSAYLAAGLSLRGIDGFADRFAAAFAKAQALFALLGELPGITVRAFEHGSNIVELLLTPSIDKVEFAHTLLNCGIVVLWPNAEWPVPVLHVNSTLLRRSNDEIMQAFAAASAPVEHT